MEKKDYDMDLIVKFASLVQGELKDPHTTVQIDLNGIKVVRDDNFVPTSGIKWY